MGKPKELWKALKALGLNSKQKSNGKVTLKNSADNLTSKHALVAQIFSKFFANLAGKLLKLLPAPMKKYGYESVDTFYKNKIPSSTSFHLVEVDQDYITNVLQNLSISKAPGIDNIPALFLHDGVSVLCKPITQLVNLSISVAEFPNKCKVAKVKPLFKKGSKIEPQNYRPISLLSVKSKVFEQVIHEQTQKFLENHNLFSKFQSGFRKNHSTDTCLSYLSDKIATGFDQGNDRPPEGFRYLRSQYFTSENESSVLL